MSIPVRALLLGLILIGNAEALASNGPQTIESRADEPREDLFASKPVSPTPVAKPASAAPPAIPATPNAERLPSGNPLWAIPLTSLKATREQPLFAPSRRPPPVASAVAAPPVPAAPPPKPPEPETPQLSLLGTVAGSGERMGLFVDSATKAVLRLRAGENHKGWVLRSVRPRQVELAKGLDNAVLDLPAPNVKAGGGPPMLTAPGVVSANPQGIPPTITPPFPINAATGALPPTGVPGLPPPAYNPSAAQINRPR